MYRPALCFVFFGCLAWSISTVAANAAGDFVILGEGNAFWTNNLEAPVSKELIKLQKRHTFRSVAFAPTGDWLILTGGNGFYTSNLKLAATTKLRQLQKPKTDFKCVAFAPDGGWTILWNQNGNWTEGGVPEAAFNKVQEVVKGGGTLRGVAFDPNGAWVVLFDQTGIWCGNIPDDLGKVFDNAIQKGLTVRCVCFTADGNWICLTNNGWWTSDLEPEVVVQCLVREPALGADFSIGFYERTGTSPRGRFPPPRANCRCKLTATATEVTNANVSW